MSIPGSAKGCVDCVFTQPDILILHIDISDLGLQFLNFTADVPISQYYV